MRIRRREPLHERLAREGGLRAGPMEAPAPPSWLPVGIHGVSRPREWDAVIAVDAPSLPGNQVTFVVVSDDVVVLENGEGDVAPLADAARTALSAPFRADAVRRSPEQWAVGLRRIEIAELPEALPGDELTLTIHRGERTLLLDGRHSTHRVPELERLASRDAVVQAERLTEALWEVRVSPL